MHKFLTKSSLTLLGAIAFSGAALAQTAAAEPDAGASGSGGRHHGPPQEAIAACAGKTDGATVSFTGRTGKSITGTCKTGPDGVMAARPEHSGHGSKQGATPGPGTRE